MDLSSQITRHFKWHETLTSKERPDLHKTYVLTQAQRRNCYLLALYILEPVREKFGPVVVTSWIRPDYLNSVVGGSETSQHLTGAACDFVCPRAKMMDVFDYLADVVAVNSQVFYYTKRGHVHVGLPDPDVKPLKQIKE